MGNTLGVAPYKPRVVLDTIEAVRLTEKNIHDVAAWSQARVYEETGDYSLESLNGDLTREPEHYLSIVSKFGVRKAKIGDYIVKKDGQFQPYPADKFERAYTVVPLNERV